MKTVKRIYSYTRNTESYTTALKRFASIVNDIKGYDAIKITKRRKFDAARELALQLRDLYNKSNITAFNEDDIPSDGDITMTQTFEEEFADETIIVAFVPQEYILISLKQDIQNVWILLLMMNSSKYLKHENILKTIR